MADNVIEWFDRSVDTRTKRWHLLYLIVLLSRIPFVLPYLLFGFRLLRLSNYPSVFMLPKEPLISQIYVSRTILDTISLASSSSIEAITALLKKLYPLKVIMALLSPLVSSTIEKGRSTTVVLNAVLLVAGGIFFCTWQGPSSTSLVQVVVCIRYISGILCVLGGVLSRFLFYYMRR